VADFYCDFVDGADVNSGATWALAKLSLSAAMDAMTADGDRVFVRRGDGVSTPADDTTSAALDATSTDCYIYGCKEGTTAEPPTASDLLVRTDTEQLPMVNRTGTITLKGRAMAHGIKLKASGAVDSQNNWPVDWIFRSSELEPTTYMRVRSPQQGMVLYDSEIIFATSTTYILIDGGATFNMFGGLVSAVGTFPSFMLDGNITGRILFMGVDLTAASGKTLADMGGFKASVLFSYCKMPATWTLADTANPNSLHGFIRAVACTNDTGLGSTASIETFEDYNTYGFLDHEQTIVYTGGADTGATGGAFSLAIQVEENSTLEGLLYKTHDWVEAWFEGDGTNKTVTIHINSDAAVDLVFGDAWLEVFTVSPTGDAQMELTTYGHDALIPPTPTTIVDGVNGDWAGSLTKAQELAVTVAPDYQGPILWRVCVAHRYASAPKTVYIDPLAVIT
jgi:hypothetical protein